MTKAELDKRIWGHDIEADIKSLCADGTPHNPRSVEIIRAIAHIDWKYNDLSVDIRLGGDGDNGESLAYLLDIFFEAEALGEL